MSVATMRFVPLPVPALYDTTTRSPGARSAIGQPIPYPPSTRQPHERL